MLQLTIKNPVSFLLALVSMDTHRGPPERTGVRVIRGHATDPAAEPRADEVEGDTYPSLLILRVISSQRLFVSTKMMVLFSFSLMISSRRRRSLQQEYYIRR
jgi:hypothetical protein